MDRPLVRRILLSALLFDGSFYVVGALVPLRAVALGASALELGLMPLLGAGSYVIAALIGGRLADHWPRLRMARWGAGLRVGVTLLLLVADSTQDLLALLPAFGLVNGLFWPGLQAALPSIAGRAPLAPLLGAFNVAWSAGKMGGFVLGGILVDVVGYTVPIWLAAIAGGLPALLLPADRRIASLPTGSAAPGSLAAAEEIRLGESWGDLAAHDARTESARGDRDAHDARTGSARGDRAAHGARTGSARAINWRRVGWTSNFLLFGVGATLNYHYPKLLDSRGLGGTEFGIFLGIAYFVQTIGFLLFGRWRGWHHRAGWLLGAQLLVGGALVVLPALEAPWAIWAVAPAIGAGLGLAYSSSLYYTLLVPGGHGRSTGLHEAILASGSFLLPFLGGLLVRVSGSLFAPYLFAGAVIVLGVGLEGAWLHASSRRSGRAGPR